MRLGVFTILFGNKPFEEVLDEVARLGIEMVELGCGNYPGNSHCKADTLLDCKMSLNKFKDALKKRNLEISGLSCHGNPLHPEKNIAEEHAQVQRKTILLAEKLGVDRVITFSGCPGDSENSKYPNWVTCPWPEDYTEVLRWQWERKVFPYWMKEASFAKEHNVKICLEMHPGFVVYNPESLLKLRNEVGDQIGVNLDPSHLFWQGIDPLKAIRILRGAIYHVHAKDTKIDMWNTPINGVLDTKPYSDEINRSWIFRTVGYGHGYDFWKDLVSTLRMNGYDYVLSIEHEDSLMSADEGLKKAVGFLREVLLKEKSGKIWWA